MFWIVGLLKIMVIKLSVDELRFEGYIKSGFLKISI